MEIHRQRRVASRRVGSFGPMVICALNAWDSTGVIVLAPDTLLCSYLEGMSDAANNKVIISSIFDIILMFFFIGQTAD